VGQGGRAAGERRIRRRLVITSEDPCFVRDAARWAATADLSSIDTGLSRQEARRRAADLIRTLRRGPISLSETPLSSDDIDILYAACELLTERFAGRTADDPSEVPLYDIVAKVPPPGSSFEQAAALADSVDTSPQSTGLLDDARRLYEYVSAARWPKPDFGECADLLAASAFIAWRIARRSAAPPETDIWQKRLSVFRCDEPQSDKSGSANTISKQSKTDPIFPLEIPLAERAGRQAELFLNDPETLLPLLECLRSKAETSPAEVLEETTFLYQYLEHLEPPYPIDAFLLDEREYFLGETARIAGTVSRILARRDEARRWLDLSEGWFLLTENAAGNLSKVSYQRLAVRMEERDFEGVGTLAPQLIASFERLGMREDALKALFLQAAVLRETEQIPAAIDVYLRVVDDAKKSRNDALLAHAYTNLVQLYGFLGRASEAVEVTQKATPLLRDLGNHVAIAKLQWGLAYLQRSNGNLPEAIETFRLAQQEFNGLAMRADVAAVHLVIADLLLDAGQDRQAEWEIRQALPIIDEYKLVPEGFAALSLLRESLRRQKIDRQALRNLHGYFEELSS